MRDCLLFSGSSNPPLAEGIARALNISLGAIEITRFMDNECRVRVEEDVAGKKVFVVQSLSQVADQHMVETCLIGQSLHDLGAAEITIVMPWMGYSKQDKAFRKGEAVSAQLVAKFLEAAGFHQVVTVELHSENLVPLFRIPVTELCTHELLAVFLSKNIQKELMIVASPDAGGKSRSDRFAQKSGLPIVYLSKQRDLVSGEVTISDLSGNVEGKTVIIFDDIINTGGTAVRSSEFLKSRGAARIYLLATHAVLAGNASQMLNKSSIDEIVVTDTIAIAQEKQFPKLQIVSVAPLLARAISSLVK